MTWGLSGLISALHIKALLSHRPYRLFSFVGLGLWWFSATALVWAATNEAFMALALNGQTTQITALVKQDDYGNVSLRRVDLASLGVQYLPDDPGMNDDTYLKLSLLGIQTEIDTAAQVLKLRVPKGYLKTKDYDLGYQAAKAKMPSPGVFLNYDLLATRALSENTLAGQFDLGLFGYGWVANTRMLGKDLTGGEGLVRLDSTLEYDQPDKRRALRFGDSVNRAGSWGRPVRFGGVQWGTDFSIQPGFVTYPVASVEGNAELPSVADIYVNNILTYSTQVDAGPFRVNGLPLVSGQGDVQLVLRDLLGREQVVSQSLYTANRLLKPGLTDYSVEAGWLREDFGEQSNAYGDWLASGTVRHGFTDALTGEVRSEVGPSSQTVGIAGTLLLADLGVLDTAVATSQNKEDKQGWYYSMGLERRSPAFSFGVRALYAQRDYSALGYQNDRTSLLQQVNAQMGWHVQGGSLSVGYLKRKARVGSENELLNLYYSRRLFDDWFLGLSYAQSVIGMADRTLSLNLLHVLGDRTHADITVDYREQTGVDTRLQLQKDLPPGEGSGYQLISGTELDGRYSATLLQQTAHGRYSLEAAHLNHETAYRAGMSGGLAYIEGGTYAARNLGSSFALVEVPGQADVRVYSEHQLVATTDSDGKALVTNLRPYEPNRLSIAHQDLSMNSQIKSLELDLVPYRRAGYAATFRVKQSRSALVTVVDETGQYLPPGSEVFVLENERYPVALKGVTFLESLDKDNVIKALLPDGTRCSFLLSYPENAPPLPDLGQITCGADRP